jgi:peptidoglycan/LPS O-acetylase OafA/YrhL
LGLRALTPPWPAATFAGLCSDCPGLPGSDSLFNYFFALVIFRISIGQFLPRLVGNPTMRYLGKISYGLYVYHFPLIWLIKHQLKPQSRVSSIRPPEFFASTLL